MSYLDTLQRNASKTTARTENGAVTHSTSSNAVLDFFALAGAKRHDVNGARTLFRKAFAEDKQLAVRALFYLRDVRGGQGERQLFRDLFRDLVRMDLELAERLVAFIPEYGRWDDLFHVGLTVGVNRSEHNALTSVISKQLASDIANEEVGKSVSLLAKWMPSENASSANSREQARKLASILDMSNKEYRKTLVRLRKHIGLLEQQMSEREWESVEYGKLPSQAHRKHTKAFKRHDGFRYDEFLGRVVKGEAKVNAGTVYTYEVVDMIRNGQADAADAVWASLPDYTDGKNAIVVADVSGSMGSFGGYGYRYAATGTQPLDVSVTLALYFAERNQGPFKDFFITFSDNPELVKVQGATLTEKLRNISNASWQMGTNVQRVFDLLLMTAIDSGASQDEMPQTIYIVSDMEFNAAQSYSSNRQTNFEVAKAKFEAAGYQLPTIVFWNVASRNTNVPATMFDQNVTLVSGLSQSTFRYAVQGKSPMESMLDVLNGERYAQITVDGYQQEILDDPATANSREVRKHRESTVPEGYNDYFN